MDTGSPGGEGGSPQVRMGVCRWVPGNLTLFQTKERQFWYLVPDKIVKIDTLFQTEKCETRLTFKWRVAACSGTEQEQQQRSFAAQFWKQKVTPTVLQSQNSKKYTLLQTDLQTLFQTQKGKNHILLSGTSPYSPYMGVSPPPSPGTGSYLGHRYGHHLWNMGPIWVKSICEFIPGMQRLELNLPKEINSMIVQHM